MTEKQLIAFLNALTLGDLASLLQKLDQAAGASAALGHEEITTILREARGALGGGDVRGYRRKLETAIARLGHVK